MAKNYWVRMLKTASGPRLEGKALDAGREYPVSEATIRALELPDADPNKMDEKAAKAHKDANAEKEKRIKPGFRGDVFEILKELSDADLERIKEQQEEARKKA